MSTGSIDVLCPYCKTANHFIRPPALGEVVKCGPCRRKFVIAAIGEGSELIGKPRQTEWQKWCLWVLPSLAVVFVGTAIYFMARPSESVRDAQTAMKAGNYQEALATLEKGLKASPQDGEILFQIGKCHLKLGQLGEAKKHFTAACEADPGNEKAVAKLYLKKLEKDLAGGGEPDLSWTQDALEVVPSAAGPMAAKCIDAATSALAAGKQGLALWLARQAVGLDTGAKEPAATLLKGIVFARAKANWKDPSIPKLVDLISSWYGAFKPELASVFMKLSEGIFATPCREQGVWFRMLCSLDPALRKEVASKLVAASTMLVGKQRLSEAAEAAETAAALDPAHREAAAKVHAAAAEVLLAKGDIGPQTRQHLSRLILLSRAGRKTASAMCIKYARAYQAKGDYVTMQELLMWAASKDVRLKAQAGTMMKDAVVRKAKANWRDPEVSALMKTVASWSPKIKPQLARELLAASAPVTAAPLAQQREWFTRLVRLDVSIRPEVVAFLLHNAKQHVEAGRLDEAAVVADLAAEVVPQRKADAASVHLLIGQKRLKAKADDPKAKESFSRAKQLNPKLASKLGKACVRQARALGPSADAAARRKLLDWAIELDPLSAQDAALVYEELMKAALKRGDYAAAPAYARNAVALASVKKRAVGQVLSDAAMDLVKKDPDSAHLLLRAAKRVGHVVLPKQRKMLEGYRPTIGKFRVERVVEGTTIQGVALALGRQAEPFVLFHEPKKKRLRCAVKLLDQWRLELVDTGQDGKLGADCAVAAGLFGRVHAVYMGDRAKDKQCLKYAVRQGAGRWAPTAVPTAARPEDTAGHGHAPAITLDYRSFPHIAHTCRGGVPDGALLYTYNDGRLWHTETAAPAASMPSIALSRRGTVHIAALDPERALRLFVKEKNQWSSRVVVPECKAAGFVLGPAGTTHFLLQTAAGVEVLTVPARGAPSRTPCGPGATRASRCIAVDHMGAPHVVYVSQEGAVNTVMYTRQEDAEKWAAYMVCRLDVAILPESLCLRVVDNVPRIAFTDGKTLYYAELPE